MNINLHVSRKFTEQDGFSDYELRPDHGKGIDYFDPRMIELQKKYARDLLTHVNPYTKMSYIDDPCVAVVEINNENSIVSQWLWGRIDKIPPAYEAELQKQWNAWLAQKYTSTDAVRAAWNNFSAPLGENQLSDASFDSEKLASGWNLETGNGAAATLRQKIKTLVF